MLRESDSAGLSTLCGLFGYSRQSYYKRGGNQEFAENAIEPLIVEKVKDYRENNPGLGSVKLYMIVKALFEDTGCMPGRDAFINLLRQHGLMVRMKRRRHYKTTDSSHNYRKYPNLIKDKVPFQANEIWVSDITYVETEDRVCYLSLITDAYSHKIVGWAVGPTLETLYPLEALEMALRGVDKDDCRGLIHHSDRGCQYCSHAYIKKLKEHDIEISMTQSGDPLENAIAERANGILKTEWLYKMKIKDIEECKTILERIVAFYNTERPHMSIGMQTPEVAHKQFGTQNRQWRNSYGTASCNVDVEAVAS